MHLHSHIIPFVQTVSSFSNLWQFEESSAKLFRPITPTICHTTLPQIFIEVQNTKGYPHPKHLTSIPKEKVLHLNRKHRRWRTGAEQFLTERQRSPFPFLSYEDERIMYYLHSLKSKRTSLIIKSVFRGTVHTDSKSQPRRATVFKNDLEATLRGKVKSGKNS